MATNKRQFSEYHYDLALKKTNDLNSNLCNYKPYSENPYDKLLKIRLADVK